MIDLSHTIYDSMPVYPGTPEVKIQDACTHKINGFEEKELLLSSHAGTHIDTPYHLFEDGSTIHDLPLHNFQGKAFCLPCDQSPEELIKSLKYKIQKLGKPDFILLRTDWDQYWGTKKYFVDFPLPSIAFFEFLADLEIKGVGIDCISIDPVGVTRLTAHHVILGKNKIIIENLTGLGILPEHIFDFFCVPLKIKNGDGSPVRAFAQLSN